jgi:HK97 family phage portal protein
MSFLTSLASAFKGGGGGRSPVPIGRGFISPWASAFEGRAASPPFDYASAVREGYLANPVAQRSVRIVAEGVGGAPLASDDPALIALLRGSCGTSPLLEVLAAQLLLHGNAYVQIVKDAAGAPSELFPLRPERVSVVAGADGWPQSYAYRIGSETIAIALEDERGWPNLVHLKGYHPADDHYGAGCLVAAAPGIAVHNAASAWNRALLDNAARPSGALVYNPGEGAALAPDQFERLKAELAQAFQGAGNAGRPMLLEGGLSWQSMALSPADMDFAALKAAAARDIALAFGVPPMLLGLPGDNTFANFREAGRALWRLTLLPLAGRILGGLQHGLAPWFPAATLAVDLDQVPALAEDREALWTQVSGADFLTRAEKRALLGLAPDGEAENKP